MEHTILRRKSSQRFIVYPRRWYIVGVGCLLAFSNSTLWLSYASLSPATAAFYCGEIVEMDKDTCKVPYWTSQIFQIVGALTGIFGMYITDKYGIRVSFYLGSTMNFLGATVRLISSLPLIDISLRLPLLYFGQTVAAFAQPFFLCLSTKIAEFWFADSQRGLANALCFIANPFGVAFGSLISSHIVSNSVSITNSKDIFYLNSLTSALASLVMLMTFGVIHGKPPTPPSASSQYHNVPSFLKGLRSLFSIPQFYIQFFTFGLAFAIQWSLLVTIEPMLIEQGYNDTSIYLITFTAISGVVGSIAAGVIVDRTKKYNEIIKGCYLGITICALSICFLFRYENSAESHHFTLLLVIATALLGFFATPVFPIGLELGVETTFPVAEATSSGILITGGQLQLFLVTYIMESLTEGKWFKNFLLNNQLATKNFQLSIDFWCFTTICSVIFTICTLRPKYKRLEYEKDSDAGDNNRLSTIST